MLLHQRDLLSGGQWLQCGTALAGIQEALCSPPEHNKKEEISVGGGPWWWLTL
jgi:hypothetical protein